MRGMSAGDERGAFSELERIYRDVDETARRLAAVHGARLRCRAGCSRCCVDGTTVFAIEAARIRNRRAALLRDEGPRPRGACAFLDVAGRCRIYADRPYVCRTQGLPLRWTEERGGGGEAELRDICPLNDPGTPVEELAPEECWTIGPFEERLALADIAFDGGGRVALRSLFAGVRGRDESARRAEREIRDRREIEAVIREARVCRLGLADGGEPYVVPLCFGWDGEALYFHGDAAGTKMEILARNDRVCVELDVVDGMVEAARACAWSIGYRSVMLFGRARIVEDHEEKRRALACIMSQYSSGAHDFSDESVRRTAIVKVTVERMSGKRSNPAREGAEDA